MKNQILTIATIASAATFSACCGNSENIEGVKSLDMDDFEVTWIRDNAEPRFMKRTLFSDASDSLITALGLEDGVPASMSAFLVRKDGKLLLFDTGLGAENSMLPGAMESMGVQPEDIDFLFLTHLHGDHIGGMLSPVQIKAEVSLKDTLYRKGNEYCVYIDRDCNSANVKKFIDRINIDRYVSTDIQNQIGKMRDNGIRLFHFDLGYLEGTYIRLRTIGGEKVTTGYMPHITYISDSLIVWHELDSWSYAIQNVECIHSGTTVVETISYSGKPVIFTITETDFEKRVIEIRTDDEGYVPKGLYVHSATANCFPHIVWECDGEPDGIILPFED